MLPYPSFVCYRLERRKVVENFGIKTFRVSEKGGDTKLKADVPYARGE